MGCTKWGTRNATTRLQWHLYAAGVDIRTIQAILGHADITVTGNAYIIVDAEALKAAMDNLPC